MGQDHVSGGVDIIWQLAALDLVANVHGNLPEFDNKVKIGNKV